ncbi:UNVERIFIED_CONTAM: hypothetical protein Sindi_1265700 [Sesamum indicum]
MEDETSDSLETTDTGLFPVSESGLDITEMREKVSNEKEDNFAMETMRLIAPPSLGFGKASFSSINGGRVAVPSPQDFNISEFLNLANKVVDVGDTTSIEALANLKSRWEAKYGHGDNLRQQMATENAQPFGRMPIRARRCLLELPTGKSRSLIDRARAHGIAPPVPFPMSGTECFLLLQHSQARFSQIPAPANDGRRRTETLTAGVSSVRNLQQRLDDVEADAGADLCDDANDDMEDDASADLCNDAGTDICDDAGYDICDDATADVIHDINTNVEKISLLPTQMRSFPTGLFVGNIPLTANSTMHVDDKIADAFNNSSRRTLSYIPPTLQNGEVVVRPTMKTIRNGSNKWKTTAVGYFLGKRPYFYHVKECAFSVWPGLRDVKATTNDFFFFQFKTIAYMEEVIEDYGMVGNRIWIAWDENFIDVNVVECGTQFIHCLVYIRSIRESIAITVIYRATEVADRRELWGSLETIAMQAVDILWIIGGDFNAVRDLSEICGASGDIRMAVEEFNDCIQNAGLLPLPMKGEWYTWHNCSASPRIFGKDHSPLVLYGDSQQQYGGMFGFDNYLALSPEFIPSVQQVWQHNIIGTPMNAVMWKLKALKPVFREQRRNKVDLSYNVQLAKGFPEIGQMLAVTLAVLEFFNTGRLLKQINTTLLALIPKVLFTGYNQARLPPRCALKVDIRKAYDTVEWDFMIAVMELFGFPPNFVKWIELIEQDELFSFHWKCDTSRVFQLGFADDLLLFYHADMDSIGVFKIGLDCFAIWSGLRLNVQKSHLIISRLAQGLREEMLTSLGFQEGVFPMKCLGLPLLSSRLTIADCCPLLMKIDKCIAGWEGIALSYAGRVQIIKSVPMSLSLYWASAFILPKKVTNEIEKRLRTFLWKGTSTSGYAKVAWKDLCRPKEEGGLGFKDITLLNRALMAKKLCDVITCDRTSIWVTWLYQGRFRDTSIWTIREHGGSWGWRKILCLRIFLRSMVNYQIGDGRRLPMAGPMASSGTS